MNLIIICGIPCSGKTTVANSICDKYRFEFLSKDYFKEKLFSQYGFHSFEEKKELDTFAEKTLYLEIEKRISANTDVVVDKWLQGIAPLKAIKGIDQANVIFIRLITEPGIAASRYRKRIFDGTRPISFISRNQFPIVDESTVVYEPEMTYNEMLEKASRPFFKEGIENLLEVDTSHIESKSQEIVEKIQRFIEERMK